MSPAIKCLILLAVVALFFITELIPLAITATAGAMLSPAVCWGYCLLSKFLAAYPILP